jgi:two-component system NtrC family response regulator
MPTSTDPSTDDFDLQPKTVPDTSIKPAEDLKKPLVLVVEDDEDIRDQVKWALKDDYSLTEAADRRSAVAAVRRDTPDAVLLDLGLPPDRDSSSEGLATLTEILRYDPTIKIIIVTGNSTKSAALSAIQFGAYDFINKPVALDVLGVILQRAIYLRQLEQECRALHAQSLNTEFETIVGVSPAMQKVYEVMRRVAGTDLPVLITGENGTGKELVAKVIHRQSSRREGPFVAINCGAIPENLLESELFGHERGSFTGAHRQQRGKVEYASGGTLFLDEIGELPLNLQVKLLRFLQDGEIERVGGRETIQVNARLVAATNIDLQEAIAGGRFREDLFYRLSVVPLVLPPLRERGEDPVLLAQVFLMRYRDGLNRRITGLSEQARAAIAAYAWPGNVRELENRIKRAIIMARNTLIQPEDLELIYKESAPALPTLREAKAKCERDVIEQALIRVNWNISRASEQLGISRQALSESIRKHGLRRQGLERAT